MEATIDATLEQFKNALATVATLGADVAKQEAAIQRNEAVVLERILADIKPVMRYIDSPIRESGACPGGQFSHWTYTTMAEHGIVLAGFLDTESNGDQNRGDYVGHDLILGRSGKLSYRTFTGSWSRWQGESESWSAVPTDPGDYDDYGYDGAGTYIVREPSTVTVSAIEALSSYTLEEIIKGITGAIQKAINKAESKQRTLGGRLTRLSAVHAALNA